MNTLEYWLLMLFLGSVAGILRYCYAVLESTAIVKGLGFLVGVLSVVFIGLGFWRYGLAEGLYLTAGYFAVGLLASRQRLGRRVNFRF